MEDEQLPKLGCGPPEFLSPVVYPDVWTIEHTSGPSRLRIAPSKDHIELLLTLANLWKSDCLLLYVLLVPRLEKREPGRYQSPYSVSIEELQSFCRRFKDYFEGDGRHHLWIASASGSEFLVYDRHQWIYAYGDIPSYIAVLAELGFVEGTINLGPHSHCYNSVFDRDEDELLARWEWNYSPLRPGDEV